MPPALVHLENREPIPGLSDHELMFYDSLVAAFHWGKQLPEPNGPLYCESIVQIAERLHGEHEDDFPPPLPQHRSISPEYMQQFANGGGVQKPSFVERKS